MNKIWLIVQREFLNRVQKKSFLIATILIPLIFPAIIALLVYIAQEQEKNKEKEIIYYIDESNLFKPDSSKYIFKEFQGSLADGKLAYKASDDFGFLYIPAITPDKPEGITLYTKISPSIEDISSLENMFEAQLKDMKMHALKIDQKLLDSLKTNVKIHTVSGSEEKSSNSFILAGIGMAGGILMYMFIFIYGAQIMQGIIEEKTSKVVEVIVSSVKPFQLMMGKIIGLASVGLLQFLIWIVLMTTLTFGVLGALGIDPPQQQAMQQISAEAAAQQAAATSEFSRNMDLFMSLPWAYIGSCFIFYFLGGYLLYGALFAAVGSAVDSPAEAQQFMFPITIPMLISYMSLFMFILKDPQGPISVWLSIIPFTSPIAMMGRIGFGVPLWQLILSQILLIGGFVFTTWVAGRIYRVGILMHGTKVNYKVLTKWFMMKN
ncbi:MAG TPA: ABC transporter permease [Ohtaekwangia sp.]|uniref:ABC transporter permease n=1 Tax=Ohtaekwangia sp. TaxID=2066019 RepID=UPI002F951748